MKDKTIDLLSRYISMLVVLGREKEGAEILDCLSAEEVSSLISCGDYTRLSIPIATSARLSQRHPFVRSMGENIVRQSIRQSMLIDKTIDAISSILTSNGIDFIFLKGSWSRKKLYPQPWLRRMVDVDVLVDPKAKTDAIIALERSGFTYKGNDPQRPFSKNLDREACFFYPSYKIPVEIHWGPINEHFGFTWSFQRLLRRANRLQFGWEFSCEDYICHMAIQLWRLGFYRRQLYQLMDIALLISGNKVSVERLKDFAKEIGCERIVGFALEMVRLEFGLPSKLDYRCEWGLDLLLLQQKGLFLPIFALMIDNILDASRFLSYLITTRSFDLVLSLV